MKIARISPRSVPAVVTGGAALTALALLLGGCTATPPESTPVATNSATSETPTPTPTPTQVPVFPLTGLPNETGAANASIASKIDNHIAARPQVGLQHTDVVVEELVEGGLTRYVAIWQSDIPKLYGPVRSIRGMDPSIASPYGGIITYSGGQPVFVNGMQKTDVVNVVHGSTGKNDIFYRTGEKSAPHNVIAKAENLLEAYGKDVPAPAQQFVFSADAATATAATAGEATSKFRTTFSQATSQLWNWDAETGKWLRSQGDTPDLDDKGDQLSATNVAVAEITTKVIAGTPVTQLDDLEGEAWVFTGGKNVHGTWKKEGTADPLRFFDEAGTEISFAPGNTWVELVPNTGKVTIVG